MVQKNIGSGVHAVSITTVISATVLLLLPPGPHGVPTAELPATEEGGEHDEKNFC